MKSPFKFQQYGECGAWVCEKYPNVAKHVDEIALRQVAAITESNDHVPALYQINTGIARPGFPTAGAWITYGLGSENQNLPGLRRARQHAGGQGRAAQLERGVPADRPTRGRSSAREGSPILNLERPKDVDATTTSGRSSTCWRSSTASTCAQHAGRARPARPGSRASSWPTACRRRRPTWSTSRRRRPRRATCTAWTTTPSRSFGRKCLMARRLVERGVRFVQVYSDGEWDAHSDLAGNHTGHCAATDVPIDGLLTDLKRRGLLGLDAGDLGRRVRPDAGLARERRPRPQPARLPRLDGRRGHQGGRQPRRDGRDRLPGRGRSGHASTTCTPRCCTCSASTTSG